jgi:Lon protease-like protein
LGRLTGFQESGDGRYTINLTGICRFEVIRETDMRKGFRQVEFKINDNELEPSDKEADSRNHKTINRKLVLATFKRYLEANDMDTDWDAVERTDDETLITALCMMSPYGPAEKQALLEATDLNMRAETLVAITEMALAKNSDESGTSLQ